MLQNAHYDHLEDFEKAIRSEWTLTPYKIIRRTELSGYMSKPKYSFFTLSSVSNAMVGAPRNTARLYYSLWLPKRDREGEISQEEIGQIVLHADPQLNLRLMTLSPDDAAQKALINYLQEIRIETWSRFSPPLSPGDEPRGSLG